MPRTFREQAFLGWPILVLSCAQASVKNRMLNLPFLPKAHLVSETSKSLLVLVPHLWSSLYALPYLASIPSVSIAS